MALLRPLDCRRTLCIAAAAAWLLLLATLAFGQQPDRNGEVRTKVPEYNGTRANAPIPPEMHQANAPNGLCVIASVITAGRYQGVDPRLLDLMWRKALRRPGGYSPNKLQALIEECSRELGIAEPKWASYYGPARAEVMDGLSRKGYPMGVTLTQADYAQFMHHMVTDIHFEAGKLACLVDNNRTGVYRWMPAERRLRLAIDGGAIWVFTWSQLPRAVQVVALSVIALAAALLLLSAATALMGWFGLSLISEES